MQKVSILYHSLTFLGSFRNGSKLSVLNSNMYTCKISMVKAMLDIFIENRDSKHYSK